MSKYHFIFIIWLLPAYFLIMCSYQVMTYSGINLTYDSGESYVAEVEDFDVKQIAAQTSGYIVLSFTTEDGDEIEQRLSLPVQMAQVVMDSERIPVRYHPESFRNIVIVSTYELQKNVVRVNIAVTLFGLLVTIVIALFASRYAIRKIRDGDEELQIERMDGDEPDEHEPAAS